MNTLKFVSTIHFPFDKLKILFSFLLTYLRSFRRSVGDTSLLGAGFERTANAICAKIAIVQGTHNKKTAYFVNNFVPLRLKIALRPRQEIEMSQSNKPFKAPRRVSLPLRTGIVTTI